MQEIRVQATPGVRLALTSALAFAIAIPLVVLIGLQTVELNYRWNPPPSESAPVAKTLPSIQAVTPAFSFGRSVKAAEDGFSVRFKTPGWLWRTSLLRDTTTTPPNAWLQSLTAQSGYLTNIPLIVIAFLLARRMVGWWIERQSPQNLA